MKKLLTLTLLFSCFVLFILSSEVATTFASDSFLIFNSEQSATVSSWGIKQLNATVPSGVSTGNVKVSTSTGDSNLLSFSVESGDTPNPANEGTSYTNSVSGSITSNTTWSVNTRITGDITINTGVTLTINPGVTVFFEANSDSLSSGDYTSDSEIRVYGTLVAEGTAENPIYFTSTSATPTARDWGRIRIYKTGVNSSFKFCSIRYGDFGIYSHYQNPDGIVTIAFPIENCLISEHGSDGIYLANSSGYPTLNTISFSNTIKNNIIKDNGDNGIELSSSDGYGSDSITVSILNNTIENNGTAGISIATGTWWAGHINIYPVIRNNKIQGNNTYGIYVRADGSGDSSGSDTDCQPTIENNYIYNNGNNIHLYLNPIGSDGTQILNPTIRYNVISGGTNGIYVTDSGAYDSLNPTISNNLFYGASSYQINNTTSRTITANSNFWGDTESAWDAGAQAGDKNGTVTTTASLSTSSAPMLSCISPGVGIASDTVTVYGANFGETQFTEYSIFYNLNGGTNAANPATYNIASETIILLDPSKPGYTFGGWYTEAELTNEITQITTGSTGDIDLYAKWTLTTYSITYHLDGGTNAANPTTYDFLSSTITLLDPSKTGYTFGGWYSEAEFTNEITQITTGSTGNVDLYAKWNAINYNITYYLNGGINGINPTSYTIDSSTITLQNPNKTGYTFNGWYSEAEFTNEITQINSGSTGDLDLYAEWTPTIYIITYNLNGGTNAANPATYTIETSTITLLDPSKTGYTFEGWYSEAEFTNEITQITTGSTGNVDLYAKWTLTAYTITYNLNEGTNAANPATYNIESETITLLDPNKTGYTFDSWYTEAEFTNEITQITTGSTGNLDLYAKWTLTAYTITYNLNGGTNGINPASYTIESSTITLQNPNKTGYTFNGWYTESEFTNEITQINSGSTGNVNLYAKWALTTYSITYNLNGGTNAANPATYNIESSTITLLNPNKTGYTFNGWYSESGFINEITQITTGSTGNINLYAKWVLIVVPTTTTTTISTTTTSSSTPTTTTTIPTTTTTSTTLQHAVDQTSSTSTTTSTSSTSSTTSTSSTSSTTTLIEKHDPENLDKSIILTGDGTEINISNGNQQKDGSETIKVKLPVDIIFENQEVNFENVDHVTVTLDSREYQLSLSEDQSYYETTITLPDVKGTYTMAIEVSYEGKVVYKEIQDVNLNTNLITTICNFIKSYWYIMLALMIIIIALLIYLRKKRQQVESLNTA